MITRRARLVAFAWGLAGRREDAIVREAALRGRMRAPPRPSGQPNEVVDERPAYAQRSPREAELDDHEDGRLQGEASILENALAELVGERVRVEGEEVAHVDQRLAAGAAARVMITSGLGAIFTFACDASTFVAPASRLAGVDSAFLHVASPPQQAQVALLVLTLTLLSIVPAHGVASARFRLRAGSSRGLTPVSVVGLVLAMLVSAFGLVMVSGLLAYLRAMPVGGSLFDAPQQAEVGVVDALLWFSTGIFLPLLCAAAVVRAANAYAMLEEARLTARAPVLQLAVLERQEGRLRQQVDRVREARLPISRRFDDAEREAQAARERREQARAIAAELFDRRVDAIALDVEEARNAWHVGNAVGEVLETALEWGRDALGSAFVRQPASPRTQGNREGVRSAGALLLIGIASSLSAPLAGCGGDNGAQDAHRPSAALVIVFDMSSSRRIEGELRESGVLPQLWRRYAERTGLPPGTSIDVLIPTGTLEPLTACSLALPMSYEPGANIGAAKADFAQEIEACLIALEGGPPVEGSSLFDAVQDGAETLAARGARARTLLVVSDLRDRHPMPGSAGRVRWDFERKLLPESEVLATLEAEGAIADLTGVEVVTCGVHKGAVGATAYTQNSYHTLVRIWRGYFAAAGAGNVDFLGRCALWR
ncbi:MAG: hypothetical protein ACOZNI_20200 [Myxococcota bacterium]